MCTKTCIPIVLIVLGCATGRSATAAEVDDEIKARIAAAAPEHPAAKPQRRRKLLVFTFCRGVRHGCIPVATEALRILGEKTGAYIIVASENVAMFEPQTLARFDAVCMQNTTGELFLPPNFEDLAPAEKAAAKKRDARLKQSLLEFVKGGKGLVGIHAATDCFYQWPEYGELMGGYFHGHPWNEAVTIKLDEPGHPLNAAFAGEPLVIADEIYQFKDPYSRERLRVLLSLDTSKTDMNKEGIHRQDGDFAVSWVRSFGQGRVFYCSLGHRDEIFWDPKVLRHYLAGIQFALGDLPAETAPSRQPASSDFVPLFNDQDLNGWQCKPGSWTVVDGVLARQGGGDIWTTAQFGNFVLELEFKLAAGTNSGIFFRTADTGDCVQTGIELQVLDSYGKETPDKHDCGAIYDLLEPARNAVKPPGEWNHVVLRCHESHIAVTMNGESVIAMDLNDWTEAGRNPDGTQNKFRTAYKDMPRAGHIGFQDHGKPVWFRNIRLRRLPD